MTTLVLNVDRDNDFGRKTKLETPIVGEKDNKIAANKLGIIDPEDSDLNAIFSAISTYQKLKKQGEEVAIATICGHINVGIKSDKILAKQLDEVLKETNSNEIILIYDGAEDEYILPIIQSRTKITSIERVSVKQGGDLEDTYYRFVKLLGDEKVQKQFVLPLALVLIIGAIFVLLNITSAGFGAILLTLGGYLLVRVFNLERNIKFMIKEIKSGFLTGRLSFYTYIIAAIILVANVLLAYSTTTTTLSSKTESVLAVPILYFLSNMVFGIVISGFLILIGRIIDIYVREKNVPWKYWMFPFSILSFGFITYALSRSLYQSLLNWPKSFSILPFTTFTFIGFITTGILIAIVGAVTNRYIQEINDINSKEREIEKQTESF
ncbi:MAG: DUF373 family protein [Candidatus Thermoplasmatota archaeon]